MRFMLELDVSSLSLSNLEALLPEVIGEIAKRKALLPAIGLVFTLGELSDFDKIPSKLEMIKKYRNRTGCTLMDAKTMVDRHYEGR